MTPEWRRSTFCASGSCVEARHHADTVHVRDSKQDNGPILTFDPATWQTFIDTIKTTPKAGQCAH